MMRAFFFLIFCLISCEQDHLIPAEIIQGPTMGTYYSVKYVNNHVLLQQQEIKSAIENVLEVANQEMSTYLPGSEISKWNKSDHGHKVSPWFFEVASFSVELSRKTNGAYDPTVGPLVNSWGFGPLDYTKKPSQEVLANHLESVGFEHLSFSEDFQVNKDHPKTMLDLSSSAKGAAVDKVSEALLALGIKNYFVEIGGEIRAAGYKSPENQWFVGVENPAGNQKVQLSLPLVNMAIATSGNYRNFAKNEEGEVRHHTISPKTGRPFFGDFTSVTILAPSCMEADALATALMAMNEETAMKYVRKHHVPAFFIKRKNSSQGQGFATPEFEEYYGRKL